MTKKHFEAAAEIVKAVEIQSEAEKAAQYYIQLFRSFNPRFDEDRFRKACGL